MKPAASSSGVRGRYGGFGVKSVAGLVAAPRPPPPNPVARTGAPGACFTALPAISYCPSMTAMLARRPAPSGVNVRTDEIGVPWIVIEYLRIRLLPAAEM